MSWLNVVPIRSDPRIIFLSGNWHPISTFDVGWQPSNRRQNFRLPADVKRANRVKLAFTGLPQTGKFAVRTEDLPCIFEILDACRRMKGESRCAIICLLSPGCTKTFKNARVMHAIFCKENVLSHAFCKLSSLGAALLPYN